MTTTQPSKSLSPDNPTNNGGKISENFTKKLRSGTVDDLDLSDDGETDAPMYPNNPNTLNTHYTLDEAITFIGFGKFQYLIIFIAGLIWFSAAGQLMLTSPLLLLIRDSSNWSLDDYEETCVSSVIFVGEMVGAYVISIMADKYGRKKAIIFSMVLCAFFTILSAISTSFGMLVICRICVGFAIGGSLTTLSLFAEFMPKENRGEMTIIELSFWSIGSVFVIAFAWILYSYGLSWRLYLVLMGIPCLLSGILALFIPESPRYLLSIGENDKVENILYLMSRINQRDLNTIGNSLLPHAHTDAETRGNVLNLFLPSYRYTTFLIFVAVFMAVVGYFGVALFQLSYFESFGGNNNAIFWEMLLCTTSELPGCIICIVLVDRIGRIPFMTILFGITSLCFFGLIFSSLSFGIFLLFLCRMCVCVGYNVLFVYILEFYPTSIRATALGATITEARFGGILSSYVSTSVSTSLGAVVYCVASLIATVTCALLPHETLNQDLHDDLETDETKKDVVDDIFHTPLLQDIQQVIE